MVTDRQVLLLRHKLKQGHTLSSAAAATDMSERTARGWQDGPLPSHTKTPRSWRTRQDPFEDIFEAHVVPRIRPGHPQENGVAERHNALIKSLLAQALVLRGSKDFATRQDSLHWAREMLDLHHNASRQDALERERAHLRALPAHRLPEYSEVECKVRRTSTVRVHRHSYSVSARLIGLKVQVRLFAERVEILHQAKVVCRGERLRGTQPRARIDYRHVIGSLLRKPGAFDQYCWREELFPSLTFRHAHDVLRGAHPDRTGRLDVTRTVKLARANDETGPPLRRELEPWRSTSVNEQVEGVEPNDRAEARLRPAAQSSLRLDRSPLSVPSRREAEGRSGATRLKSLWRHEETRGGRDHDIAHACTSRLEDLLGVIASSDNLDRESVSSRICLTHEHG